ncbi:MAG TPA: DUF4440 domain-containing protein [Candidatus Krumholzibacteria bacterium]|nr:DUF4440 domain-containing protein [Candidatus Krumholzibacteria bacterium]
MKHLIVSLSILGVAVFGCAKKIDVEAERAALRQADADWNAAVGAKSTDDFMKFMEPEATIMPPNEAAVSGTAAIQGWVAEMMAIPGFGFSWQATSVEVAASGDLGCTVGTYDAQIPLPDGSSVADNGKYVTMWRKQVDGSWKVYVDIFNSDLPMPTSPEAPDDATGAAGQ